MKNGSAAILELGEVDHCVSGALNLLRQTYTSLEDGGGGWYHQLALKEPGPTATALALSAFFECGESFEHFEAGLTFLASRQIKSIDPLLAGGWALNTSLGRPVVEATGWVVRFLGLARCSQFTCAPDIELGFRWLLANQNPDGGWGSLHGAPSRVWLTCVALRGLAQVDPHNAAIERGSQWLMNQQSSDPCGWAEVKGRQVSVTHTAMSLLTISELRRGGSDSRIVKAYDWLGQQLDTSTIDDHNARVESYNVESESEGRAEKLRWHTILLHYGLPVAMSAIIRHPEYPQGDLIASGYRTIIRTQQATGEWPNIQGGNDASIWALWPFVQALLDLKKTPITRPGDALLWTPHVVVVRRFGSPPDVLTELARAQRRASVLRFLSRNWSALLVMLSVLAGLVLVGVGSLDLKDYLLGLIVPIALLLAQELRKRRSTG